jgi:hypothetical protein
MLWNCSGDVTYRMNDGVPADPAVILHTAVNHGFAYGMNYMEIYQVDVINLPAEITYAHQLLLGIIPPDDPPPPSDTPAAPTGLHVVP